MLAFGSRPAKRKSGGKSGSFTAAELAAHIFVPV